MLSPASSLARDLCTSISAVALKALLILGGIPHFHEVQTIAGWPCDLDLPALFPLLLSSVPEAPVRRQWVPSPQAPLSPVSGQRSESHAVTANPQCHGMLQFPPATAKVDKYWNSGCLPTQCLHAHNAEAQTTINYCDRTESAPRTTSSPIARPTDFDPVAPLRGGMDKQEDMSWAAVWRVLFIRQLSKLFQLPLTMQ